MQVKMNSRLIIAIKESRFKTQEALAEAIGITGSIISGIIQGRIIPRTEEIEKINNALERYDLIPAFEYLADDEVRLLEEYRTQKEAI